MFEVINWSNYMFKICLKVFSFLLSMDKTLSPTHPTNRSASFKDCTCASESGSACLPRWRCRLGPGGTGDGTTAASGVASGFLGHLLLSFIGVFFCSDSLGLIATCSLPSGLFSTGATAAAFAFAAAFAAVGALFFFFFVFNDSWTSASVA